MRTPPAIKVISAYCLLRSLYLLIVAALVATHPEYLMRVAGWTQHVLPVSLTKVTLARLLLSSVVAGIVSLVLGIGLLLRSDKARWGLLLLCGIPLARLAIALLLLLISRPTVVADAFADTVRLADIANAIIVWCLVQPDAKRAFGETAA